MAWPGRETENSVPLGIVVQRTKRHRRALLGALVQYCEKLMGVVVFAKVQGQVKSRTFRLCKSCSFSTLLNNQNMISGGSENSWMVMVHYCEKLMGVVVFARVQGQVKFESPQTFVKTTIPISSSQ